MCTPCGFALLLAFPTAAAAQWTSAVTRDPMTNQEVVVASSPNVVPSQEMDFPYKDTHAWMAYMCDGKNEWLYFGFSDTPNIDNAEPEEGGFSHFRTRVRWGTEIKNVEMSQKWGASVISFSDGGGDAVKRLARSTAADSLLLELHWFGNGSVYFNFPLEGAAEAIANAKGSCKK